MNEYSRALNSARIALGVSQSALRSGEPLTEQLQEAIDAGLEGLSLLSNWPAQPTIYETIHDWLAQNNPAALELCPYKVNGQIGSGQDWDTPPPDGWQKDYYEARLVSTFETLAKIDNAEVSEIVGAFIAGYFADRIERAERS